MKTQILFILTCILTLNTYAQISFEKGYFINNDNQKVDCFIKNIDWRINPTDFQYKLEEGGTSSKIGIDEVKEFGINEFSKYVRSYVEIDRSSEAILGLSNERKAIFETDTLFLKVLVEGKASLYEYYENNMERYFFSKNNSAIEQLVYKTYQKSGNTIGKNLRFQQQLINNLDCSDLTNKVKNLKYERKSLIPLFVKYNKCENEPFIDFNIKQKRDAFNLNIRPGLNYSSLSIANSTISSRNVDFDSKLSFRFGIEGEFIMKFNNNKWAIIIEPTYQYFQTEKEVGGRNKIVNYQTIDLPLGIRHYFYLNENSKVFVNGLASYNFDYNSYIDLGFGTNLRVAALTNLAFGVGYKQHDKLSIELRYQTHREILWGYVSWRSAYRNTSLILSYSIF